MRKILSAALIVYIVALLSTLLIPTLLATTPTYVSGGLAYAPAVVGFRWADGNLFLETTEEGWWYDAGGNLIGYSWDAPCRVVVHNANGLPATDWDFRWYTAIATFEYFIVDGKSGGLVMRLHGTQGEPGTDWFGQWVIISGTEDLANLRGQGTWGGPGFQGVPSITIHYEGWIHFD